MHPIIQAVLNLLELLWKAADQDARELLNAGEFDAAQNSIVRQETIAEVIDAIKNLGGVDRG